jgi:aryl-alcohol dehydrogenase-like predicted oxidoreductase
MIPRFSQENRDASQAPVDHVRTFAEAKDAAPGQVALAWLPAQQPWTVPIPRSRGHRAHDVAAVLPG